VAITNGSAILKADLDALVSTQLGLVQDDNEQVPGSYTLHFQFRGVVDGSTDAYAKAVFVCPFDCYLETFAVSAGDQTAASTVKAAITGDGTLVNDLDDAESLTDEGKLVFWPVKVSGAAGSGHTKLTRLLYDGTKTRAGVSFATTSRAHRTLLKGSTLTVSVATSGIATASLICVALVLREFWARE
jgi:hypothetical protein